MLYILILQGEFSTLSCLPAEWRGAFKKSS